MTALQNRSRVDALRRRLDAAAELSALNACHHAAMRHMLASVMTARNTTTEEPPRTDAALVYSDRNDPDRWFVGAPDRNVEPEAFSGPNACLSALEYAHRRYGSARFFKG